MLDINKIIKDYQDGKSIREIATLYNTYPNKISRTLKNAGFILRTKHEAGKLAIENGKIIPPMLGKKRTQDEKANISSKRSKKWKEMSEDDLEEFKNNARKRWDSYSVEDRILMQQKAGEALKRASIEGSKAEKFIYEGLTKLGHDVIIHKTGLIAGEKYEIDLFLPSLNVAIEIDGPQHFLPIYGADSLNRTIKYDSIKNGVLLSKGICVIRIKYMLKSSSLNKNIQLLKLIEIELQKIKLNFPAEGYRLIELEISND